MGSRPFDQSFLSISKEIYMIFALLDAGTPQFSAVLAHMDLAGVKLLFPPTWSSLVKMLLFTAFP